MKLLVCGILGFVMSVAVFAAGDGRELPSALPGHPGNVFLEGEEVTAKIPGAIAGRSPAWRVLDDRRRVVLSGAVQGDEAEAGFLRLGELGIGWYRIEFGSSDRASSNFTTAAVLGRLRNVVPDDSPVCVDSATAWFARDDAEHQRRLANLAALAGVRWVRDRTRWSDLQPAPGPLEVGPTTYDTAAALQHEAGLNVLQVFHDTPVWARESPRAGGRFAPDLRHVYAWARDLARRFRGSVQAWEPWNEANVATFGAHTVDQMCSWQKAAWLGFKAGDPGLVVGWNASAAVPTAEHTRGVLANETWPYYDTYNIHTYDWAHAYLELWAPAREAAAGRPLWITEADRGTQHLKQPPFYDQDPRLELLKAEWMAQAYAQSLFAGAQKHFHFILGHYHEPNSVQFGLLRLDLTPRPAYVALAAVGRFLAGARVLGRWEPEPDLHVYAFRAQPNGRAQDVLVIWAEKDVDWAGRGTMRLPWSLPAETERVEVADYLGRPMENGREKTVTSAPMFVVLPPGQAEQLPLEAPPPPGEWRSGEASPVVLQIPLARSAGVRVEDRPWSEGYAYGMEPGREFAWPLQVYNFSSRTVRGSLRVETAPLGWEVSLDSTAIDLGSMERQTATGRLRVKAESSVRDGWVTVRADCGWAGRPVLAFRVLTGSP